MARASKLVRSRPRRLLTVALWHDRLTDTSRARRLGDAACGCRLRMPLLTQVSMDGASGLDPTEIALGLMQHGTADASLRRSGAPLYASTDYNRIAAAILMV